MPKPPSAPKSTFNSSAQIAAILVSGVLLLVIVWSVWDHWSRHHEVLACDDGKRYAIDTRQFDTQYLAYSLKLEASMDDKRKLSLALAPEQQAKLSEAIMSANEFRKFLVAGFDSCAVTKIQYARYGVRFQALDSFAHQIDELSVKATRSPAESASLSTLITRYSDLAHQLGTN